MYRLLTLLMLPVLVACEPGDPVDAATAQFEAQLRAAEESRERVRVGLTSDGDAEALAADAVVVDAFICVGAHCGWGTGRLEGGVLTVTLPADASLVGLEVTAYVPATGQRFSGTYR